MAQQAETIDLARFKGLLLERRAALLGRIDGDTTAERETTDAKAGPRDARDGGDNATYEVAEEDRLNDAERATDGVRRIDDALARIEDGSYGTCIDCGEPIGEGRLLAVPEAERCINDQEIEDQRLRGAGHHATL